MQNRITNTETQRGGDPHRLDEILAELLIEYQRRFPAAKITVIQTPAVTMDSLFHPGGISNVS